MHDGGEHGVVHGGRGRCFVLSPAGPVIRRQCLKRGIRQDGPRLHQRDASGLGGIWIAQAGMRGLPQWVGHGLAGDHALLGAVLDIQRGERAKVEPNAGAGRRRVTGIGGANNHPRGASHEPFALIGEAGE